MLSELRSELAKLLTSMQRYCVEAQGNPLTARVHSCVLDYVFRIKVRKNIENIFSL